MMVNIKIKRMNADTVDMSVDLDWTVTKLKTEISNKINVPVPRLRLILLGRLLKDPQVLHEVGLREGQAVHVVEREESPEQSQPSQPQQQQQQQSQQQQQQQQGLPSGVHNVIMSGGFSVQDQDGNTVQTGGGLEQVMGQMFQDMMGGQRGQQARPAASASGASPSGSQAAGAPAGGQPQAASGGLEFVGQLMQDMLGAARGAAGQAQGGQGEPQVRTSVFNQMPRQSASAQAQQSQAAQSGTSGATDAPAQQPAGSQQQGAFGVAALPVRISTTLPSGAPQQQQPQQQQNSGGSVQGVHVVVHATPADLETLPQRLATFQQQLEQQTHTAPPIHIFGGNASVVPPQQPQQPQQQQQQQQPLNSMVQSALSALGSGVSAVAATVAQQAAQANASANANASAASEQQAAQPTQAPSQTQQSGLLKDMVKECTAGLALQDVMQAGMGNLAALDSLETPAVSVLKKHLPNDTPAAREALVKKEAATVVAAMRDNAAVMRYLGEAEEAEAGVREKVLADTEKMLLGHGGDLIAAVLDVEAPGQFGQRLVKVLKEKAGHWIHRMERLLPNGMEGVKTFAKILIDAQTPLLPQQLVGAVPFAVPLIIGKLGPIHTEYAASPLAATDDQKCSLAALPPRPVNPLSVLSPAENSQLARSIAAIPTASAPQQLSPAYLSGAL